MLRSNRLGQGLPITTIIIAALALIVLVIMGFMVYQRTGKFGEGTREISEQECKRPNTIEPLGTNCEVIYSSFKNVDPDKICCREGTVQ